MALKLEDYKVGWITALPIEAAAAKAMLDTVHPRLSTPDHDSNIYSFGHTNSGDGQASGGHNVVIASGRPGTTTAATVANDMRRTFPWLRIGLMVGIAGGVWHPDTDVRLGDVVVGVHSKGEAGVVQYDYGRQIQDEAFIKTGSMNKAPAILLNAVNAVQSDHMCVEEPEMAYVAHLERDKAKKFSKRPAQDRLFNIAYVHSSGSCDDCDKQHLRTRPQREHPTIPKIHYGPIASGNRLIRDAVFAEAVREKYSNLCFETEAAGLDNFPSLTIRGISDYCDTHKNDDWHQYAAVAAAAYAKELLSVIGPTAVVQLPQLGNTYWNVPRAPSSMFTGRRSLLDEMKKHLITERDQKDLSVFVLQGIGGAGKSEAAIKFATEQQDSFWGIFWIDAEDRQSIETGFTDIARMQVPPLQDTTLKDVTQWLATTKESWLLILDNCDDSQIDFAKYLPSRGGSVIITTRLTECRIHGTWKNIDELGKGDATQLLLKASGLEGSDQKSLIPVAESVVSILGQHALALVHAGAYIRRGHCTLGEYVQFFRDERSRLMKFKPEQQASRHGSVYTTFEVSAKALASSDRHDSHLALRLLNILAFMDREAVEEEVFISAFDECHEFEGYYGYVWEENEVQLCQCCAVPSTEIDPLAKHRSGSVKHDGSESMTDMSCNWRGSYRYTNESEVQEHEFIETGFAIESMHKNCLESTESITRKSIVPGTIRNSTLSDCVPVIGHPSKVSDSEAFSTEAVETPAPGDEVSDDGELDHLHIWHRNRVRSSGLVERHKTSRLRTACIRLADLSLIKLSNNTISMHPLVHEWAYTRLSEVTRQDAWEQALSILALSSFDLGWTPFLKTIVSHTKTCIRNLGRDKSQLPLSLNVARALFHLAQCCHLDISNEASLAIFEALSVSPEMQPHTWSSRNSLVLREKAECLGELGRAEEMQSCVDQIVQSTSRWFELDSWETYSCQMLLADAYCTAGNFRDAVDLLEPLYERILQSSVLYRQDQRNFLLALSRANKSLGNRDRAASLLVEALDIAQRDYPLGSSTVRNVLHDLSDLYITMGVAEKAVILLEDAVKLGSKQMPPDHTWFWIASNLARAYIAVDEYDQAILIFESMSSYDLSKEVGFADAPTKMMGGLAIAYIKSDKHDQAVPLLEEVVEAERSSRPLHDSNRLGFMKRLAEAYVKVGKPDQAVLLLEEVVKVNNSRLPLDDLDRCRDMDEVAAVYLELDKPHQAVPLLEEVVQIYRSSVLNDRERHGAIDRLAQAYITLQRPDQAVLLLEELIKHDKSNLSPDDLVKLGYMARLGQAYINHDRPDQAVVLLEELVEIERSSLPVDDMGRLVSVENLADAYLDLDKPNEAVTLFEELINNFPAGDPTRLSRVGDLANVYLTLDKPDQAVALLGELGKDLPTDFPERKYNVLAQAYLTLNMPDRVVGLLEGLVKCLPEDVPERLYSRNMLADAYNRLGKPSQAVLLLEEVVKCLPADAVGRTYSINLLSDACLQLDKPFEAVALLEELVGSLPADAPGRLFSRNLLANAYNLLEKPSQAVALLEEVVKCLPADAIGRRYSINMLSDAYLQLEKPCEAVALLEELINSFPPDAQEKPVKSIGLLADAYYQLGKPSQAAKLLEDLVERFSANDPARLESVNMLANSYLILDKPDQTVILLEDLVKCLPSDPPGNLTNSMELLAEALWKLDRLDEETLLLECVVAWDTSHLAGDNVTRLISVRRLARAYTRLGTSEKLKEAVSMLEELMDQGKDTLYANPEEFRITGEILADAQEKLRQISGERLPAHFTEAQRIPDVVVKNPQSSTFYQYVRRFLKRSLPLMDLDDGSERNNDKRPRMT